MAYHLSNFNAALSLLAKVLCIAVLITQAALLDYIIFRLDESLNVAAYIFIAFDIVLIIFWIVAMVFSFKYFHKPLPRKITSSSHNTAKEMVVFTLKELPFAYVSWIFYAVIIIVKINVMFVPFAEVLTSRDESLLTNTSLKMTLSLCGVIFALLTYSHHDEGHNTKYKLLIEKLGASASLDLLDCIMLLNILFVVENGVEVTFRLDRTIRAFSSICILLPIFPLFALRFIDSSEMNKSSRLLPLVLVLNSSLYLLLVNVPLLCIRMFLWFHHDLDVTTFLTKNLIQIFKELLDIYRELVVYARNKKTEQGGMNVEQLEQVL